KAEIGFAYGQLKDNYLQSSNISFANTDFDFSRYNLFAGTVSIEQNSLNDRMYSIKGKQKFLKAQYVTGKEKYLPAPTSQQDDMKDESTHTWLQLKGRWHEYKEVNDQFNIGFLGEVVLSSKSLLNNYTATVLQAPAFTPTPHSRIVFNEAFRANQYVAAGLSPIIKMGKLLHLRLDLYGFAPLNEIKKETFQSNQSYYGVPYYGKFLRSFEYMGEAAVVLQLPFLSIGIFGNGYSYPSKNFNVGVNIGYLIFNPKMLD
ncbi:MAG: patatin, partial [bacterium]|nr:patatin [bacterium]